MMIIASGVTQQYIAKMRTYVIGDVHGAAKALLQCLTRSGFRIGTDRLIQLGDVCDGWGQVFEVIEILRNIPNLISIKGNHDEWFNQYLLKGEHPTGWLHGGHATLNSYCYQYEKALYSDKAQWITSLQPEHVDIGHHLFFRNQQLYFIDDQNRMYCHAGFDRTQYVDYLAVAAPTEFYWDRKMWNEAMSCTGDQRLKTANEFTHIFIGHTATTNWSSRGGELDSKREGGQWKMSKTPITFPMTRGCVTNMDTGGGFNGKVSIMDVDTREVWQSDLVQDIYNNEVGRN